MHLPSKVSYVLLRLSLIFLSITFVACDEYSVVNLTENLKLSEQPKSNLPFNLVIYEVWIHGADKDRNFEMDHDNITIGLKLKVTNHTDQTIGMNIEMVDSDIKGVFNFKGFIDTLQFSTELFQDSLFFPPKSTEAISVANSLYDFEGLFEKRKDYTTDMTKLLSNCHFYFQVNQKIIPIEFSNSLQVFGRSKKRFN